MPLVHRRLVPIKQQYRILVYQRLGYETVRAARGKDRSPDIENFGFHEMKEAREKVNKLYENRDRHLSWRTTAPFNVICTDS